MSQAVPTAIRPDGAASPERAGARIAGLDLLRLAAALSVVIYHFCYRGTAGQDLCKVGFPEIAGVAKYAYLGVDLFFIISGFVIAASAQGRTMAQFAIARAGRLYPAFIVCMTATAVVVAVAGMPPHSVSLGRWLANLTMLAPWIGYEHMDGAYWSIVNEIVFYGWIAALLGLGLLERWPTGIVATWLALCVLNEFVLRSEWVGTVFITDYGPLFASGMLIHRLWCGERSWQICALLALAFVLGGSHAFTMVQEFAHYFNAPINVSALLVLHSGLYALFAASLWASRVIAPTPLVLALGGITYPLYLLHQTIGYIALNRLAPLIGRWPALVLVVAGLLGAAWVVWRFLEPIGRPLVTGSLRRLLTAPGSSAA